MTTGRKSRSKSLRTIATTGLRSGDRRRPPPTARTLDGDSPLHVAAWTNALPVAEALLARGAEVDAVKRDGSTPLHLCASRGLYGMVTILLEAGADKRKTTVSGSTPADRAALFRDDRLVRSLS